MAALSRFFRTFGEGVEGFTKCAEEPSGCTQWQN